MEKKLVDKTCNNRNCSWYILIGEDEVNKSEIKIKDMITGNEEVLKLE